MVVHMCVAEQWGKFGGVALWGFGTSKNIFDIFWEARGGCTSRLWSVDIGFGNKQLYERRSTQRHALTRARPGGYVSEGGRPDRGDSKL